MKRHYKLVLTGTPSYINKMNKHLRKEHPSTRHRMKIIKTNRRK